MHLKILNLLFGFFLIFLSSCGGFFIGLMTQLALTSDRLFLSTPFYLLQKSAHSHTNLFGLIHIAFALTLRDSKLSSRSKIYQTWGLFLGSLSMSLLMILRSLTLGTNVSELMKYFSIIFLCFYILAVFTHCYGLLLRLIK